MSDTPDDPRDQGPDDDSQKLVPVSESIKYRRRAQQAEARIAQLEQQLNEATTTAQQHQEQLATAEAQRDEATSQLISAENRAAASRMLADAGAVDLETAALLLGKRIDLGEPVDDDTLQAAVQDLLLDKPYLAGHPASGLPAATRGPSQRADSVASQLTRAADRAARSGSRTDVAEYLRLRRQAAGL